jgi:hypothetical protein
VDSEKVELKLRRINFFTRWRCTICGGHIEKEEFLVEAESGQGTIRACWLCLRGDNQMAKAAASISGLHTTPHNWTQKLSGYMIISAA